jgi:hypothetical protein
MPVCQLCSKGSVELRADGVCVECAEKHALMPRTEPLRPRVPCARCNHTSLVRCHVIRERSSTAGEYGIEYIAPLAATFGHEISHTFWAARKVSEPDRSQPIGVFEAYICRKCGFTELYARDASAIPIGAEYATEEFDVASYGPYR